jgi:lipopolysaccharide/colanic/teichoic acid biosynthesis glycosyltransferase
MTLPRAIDIAVATTAAVVLAPVLALAAAGVAIDLGRPVLFVQPRSGRSGRVFHMSKLRSMRDTRDAQGQLLPDSARVSRFGRFLRRSRIDELPGLWHVIIGDISLVGPRPLLPGTIAAMGAAGSARGAVRPGLTGWAQVNGNALLGDADKLALDLWYIDNASLWLDLLILVRTVGVVITGERINPAQLRKAYAGDHRRGG